MILYADVNITHEKKPTEVGFISLHW